VAQGEIEFIRPLSAAFERTKTALFRPFRIEAWFVVGFSAWLAWLGQHGSYGSGGNWDAGELKGVPSPQLLLREWLRGIRNFFDHWAVILGVVTLVGMALVVIVVFVWLSSRAKFVFLDNVVKGHSNFLEPWSRFSAAGWSLFWWRLVFAAIVLSFFGAIAAMWWVRAVVPFLDGDPITLGPVIWMTLLAFPVGIVVAYLECFLNHFVVPIMARDGLSATAAWGRFLGLFRENAFPFVLYGLFLIPLWIVVYVGVLLVGLMTCCVGFLVLWLPYIGMVLMLPVYYAHRAFGPEFLAQFGPEWDCWPAPAPEPVA
jgi:hypothetical protein